jgi:hypothetical protein
LISRTNCLSEPSVTTMALKLILFIAFSLEDYEVFGFFIGPTRHSNSNINYIRCYLQRRAQVGREAVIPNKSEDSTWKLCPGDGSEQNRGPQMDS